MNKCKCGFRVGPAYFFPDKITKEITIRHIVLLLDYV